jgi:release factor glutamine methyltransferase
MTMTLQPLDEVRFHYREDALQRGVNPRDVDLLLGDLLGQPLSWLIAFGETPVDPAPLEALLARRYSGEPLQYIRKRTEFYSREFYVDDRVLIPRPETELLVEAVLGVAPEGGRVIDIGSGSGCIAITIERERPDLHVLSVDRSVDALAVAAINRARLESRVELAASDLMSAVRGPFDVIVSNPPYVPLGEYEELAVEVRIHEPRIALTPGPSGLEIIDRIFDDARRHLTPRGHLVLEIGYGQEQALRDLAQTKGFTVDAALPDLAGIPRVVVSSMQHVE